MGSTIPTARGNLLVARVSEGPATAILNVTDDQQSAWMPGQVDGFVWELGEIQIDSWVCMSAGGGVLSVQFLLSGQAVEIEVREVDGKR